MIRDRFSENIKKDMSTEEWLICQDTYDPQENLKNESLFALSNGYLGIRGSFEEGTRVTLPYLYVNGVFDKSETFMVFSAFRQTQELFPRAHQPCCSYSSESPTRFSLLHILR